MSYKTVTIASSGTTMAAGIDMADIPIYAIHMPAAFTGTTITFTVGDKLAGTYQQLMDDAGNVVTLTAAAAKVIGITGDNAAALAPCRYIKLVVSAQAAERTFRLLTKGFPR